MSPFDTIKQTQDGHEYWSARDLQDLMGYEKWEKFEDAITRAKLACENSGASAESNFPDAGKNVEVGFGRRFIKDYHLTRYACYLVAMNSDPRKPEVAKAQTYFAIKTHEAEVAEASTKRGEVHGIAEVCILFDQLVLSEKKRVIERGIADIRIYEQGYQVAPPAPSMELLEQDAFVLRMMQELVVQHPIPAYVVQRHMYQEHRGVVAMNVSDITASLERLAYHHKVRRIDPRWGTRVPRWALAEQRRIQ